MAGGGDLTGIFASPGAARFVDGGDEFDIARLLNRPDDGAAHATSDAADDNFQEASKFKQAEIVPSPD